MNGTTISPALPEELATAAELASRAMINLPEVVPVFRGKQGRMAASMRIAFERMPGEVFLARDGQQTVGVMRLVNWPSCRSTPSLAMVPRALLAMKSSALRGMRSMAVWTKHDPQKEHLHLDPLAVMPGRQGQGIGSRLMDHYCERLDRENVPGYLETGTTRNVRFYERFGFAVTGEAPVFGITTYLMWRPRSSDR